MPNPIYTIKYAAVESSALLVTLRKPGEDERAVFLRSAEIRSLISTLGLKIIYSMEFTIKERINTTYLGKGQAEAVREAVLVYSPEEVIIDAFITPREENNLERIFGVPVSDREALILAIFFQNARSREARLQIEKAEAEYMRPRLADREARLSQQRGGVRGAKGEGERKIELERRRISEHIRALDREIRAVSDIRKTQRKSRARSGIFSFALIGYTNAGKSTILNALTGSDVLAEDKLFATLDTTTRSLRLPNGQKVLLSDTVGFISDLPEVLIEAFSSTLEEALSSDAVIIVADASHPDAYGCLKKTKETLSNLGALDKVKLLVINKIDDIYDEIAYSALKREPYPIVETSIKNGAGINELLKAMAAITDESFMDITVEEPIGSDIISRIAKDGTIRSIDYGEDTITVTARIRKELERKYKRD